MSSGPELEIRIKELALALGFDLAGIAEARATPETRFLRDWLARGYAGEMGWLARRAEERIDPRRVLDGARSVVAVGLVYDRPPTTDGDAGAKSGRDPADAAPSGTADVARYARGDDYHALMRDRLRALEGGIEALTGAPLRSRAYVDTGPVQERVFAAYAGLGWIGKNTCLIHPRLGSYVFLGVLLTDLALAPDAPTLDHCGTCRACLDACPTDALRAPYELDARRCIAYTTIELRGAIPEPLREAHGGHIFGCDVCQEVCPWNQQSGRERPPDPLGLHARLEARPDWLRPTLAWVLDLDEDDWRSFTRRSAIRRARHRDLLRNALVAAGNSGDAALKPRLERFAAGADPLLAEHARWALDRLASLEGTTPRPQRV